MTARALFASAALVLALAAAAPAAFADPASDTRAVIERQLDAFSRDAWEEAFDYAAPSIQGMFQTPENFSRMVTQGYPMVWRPAEVDFLDTVEGPGGVIRRLRIVDAAGDAYIARYFMRRIDGEWRIAGVDIEREPKLAA